MHQQQQLRGHHRPSKARLPKQWLDVEIDGDQCDCDEDDNGTCVGREGTELFLSRSLRRNLPTRGSERRHCCISTQAPVVQLFRDARGGRAYVGAHTHTRSGLGPRGSCFYCLREVSSITSQKPLLQTQTHARTYTLSQTMRCCPVLSSVCSTHTHTYTPTPEKSDTSGKEKGSVPAGSGRTNEGRFYAELDRVCRFPLVFFKRFFRTTATAAGRFFDTLFFTLVALLRGTR